MRIAQVAPFYESVPPECYSRTERVISYLTEDKRIFFDLHRLPELFCGFPRRPGESPTLYPVACAPQAWASAAIFLLLQACLGLDIVAPERRLVFSKPFLPQFLSQVSIRDLKVGEASVDLLLTRHNQGDVGGNVLRRNGILDVVVLK